MYDNITTDDSINPLPDNITGDKTETNHLPIRENFSSSLKYINIISIFFGVMPVHVKEKANYHILGVLMTFLYIAICIYFCIHPIVLVTNINEEREIITDWIWKLEKFHYTYVLSNTMTLAILFIHTRKILKLGRVIKQIQDVDNLLISHDVITRRELRLLKYKEVKYFILVIILCVILILGSSIIMTHKYYADNPFKMFIVIQDFIHMCAFCVELQFHAFIIMVKHRFDLVNSDLVHTLHILPPFDIVEPGKFWHAPYRHHKIYTLPSRLHSLTHIHSLLMAACIKSNRMFHFQMLLDVFNTCVLLLVDLYSFMFQVLYTDMSWFDIFNIWPIHHTLKLILIAYSGHVIKENIYTTKNILSIARISTKEVSATVQNFIQREVEVYLLVLNNSKFSHISLYRIINVDLNMLLRILNATCTYVLIMLQYKWDVF